MSPYWPQHYRACSATDRRPTRPFRGPAIANRSLPNASWGARSRGDAPNPSLVVPAGRADAHAASATAGGSRTTSARGRRAGQRARTTGGPARADDGRASARGRRGGPARADDDARPRPRARRPARYPSGVDPLRARALLRTSAVGVAALGGATALVALLQLGLGVPNPSAVYILAVAIVALVGGRVAVLAAAVASFLLYDFLFVDPRYMFTVADPGEWLNLVLLLAVGLLVGQMAALLRIREETAVTREREARTLFSVSRELVTRPSTIDVLPRIVEILLPRGEPRPRVDRPRRRRCPPDAGRRHQPRGADARAAWSPDPAPPARRRTGGVDRGPHGEASGRPAGNPDGGVPCRDRCRRTRHRVAVGAPPTGRRAA